MTDMTIPEKLRAYANDLYRIDDADLFRAADVIEKQIRELTDYKALVELQHTRMGEATARWRAEDPQARDQIMPDLGDLLRWLMNDADQARGEVTRLNAEVAACWPIVAAASAYMSTYASPASPEAIEARPDRWRALWSALQVKPADPRVNTNTNTSGCPNCPPGYDCETGNYATTITPEEANT